MQARGKVLPTVKPLLPFQREISSGKKMFLSVIGWPPSNEIQFGEFTLAEGQYRPLNQEELKNH